MASAATINVMATLTLSRFVAEIIKRDCPADDQGNHKVLRLADRLVASTIEARNRWPECSPKDVRQVEDRVRVLGETVLRGDRQLVELCAVVLGLLADMLPHLKGNRLKAMADLEGIVERVNACFDSQGRLHECYAFAGRAVDQWQGVCFR